MRWRGGGSAIAAERARARGAASWSGRTSTRLRPSFERLLDADEAAAFDMLVERRETDAAGSGATVSASGVLRAIVRAALEQEGLLPKARKGPKR